MGSWIKEESTKEGHGIGIEGFHGAEKAERLSFPKRLRPDKYRRSKYLEV